MGNNWMNELMMESVKGTILDAKTVNIPKESAYELAKCKSTIDVMKQKLEAYKDFKIEDVIKVAIIEGQLSGSIVLK